MGNLNINLKLRPIRFGFLVRPEDSKHIKEIFEINTCLWGGKFNPIIPYFKKLPSWWDRNPFKADSALQVVNGYLDFFEPDFIVEAEKGIADDLGFDKNRVIQLTDMLKENGVRNSEDAGLSVFDLYKELYEKEFQFVRRHPRQFAHVLASEKSKSLFVACVFGAFPKKKTLKYFESAFKEAFDPKTIKLSDETVEEIYKLGFISPLRTTHLNLKVDYHGYNEETLYILDANEPKDLLDYWNYRAIHRATLPIPIQHLKKLSQFCKNYISSNHRPIPGNSFGTKFYTNVIISRSIGQDKFEGINELIKVDDARAYSLQSWYPPIWRKASDLAFITTRPTISAKVKRIDANIDEEAPSLRFSPLVPEFAEEYGGGEYRWANLIKVDDWSGSNQLATIFPTNYRKPIVPKIGIPSQIVLPTTEGLVMFPRFREITETWSLTDGTSAINDWFKKNNIKAVPSDAGRATQQIIQALGGLWGVGNIAYSGIVQLLEEMSRKTTAKSCHSQEFRNKVRNAVSEEFRRDRTFEELVKSKVVELGLEVKCGKCESWSWYNLKQLDYSVTCDLCLKKSDFPITEPTNSDFARWAYRVVGPFALPNFARGGYASALTIRCISDLVGAMDKAGVTWSAGQELTIPGKRPIESDIILWYERKNRFGLNHPTEIVFGEAKSFGWDVFKEDGEKVTRRDAFTNVDITRMKMLAEEFPGAVLVFSTMKRGKDLTKNEVKMITKLAEWGREYDKKRREMRAPVIVLTGAELFAPHQLEIAWQEMGGRHAAFAKPQSHYRLDNLQDLADITQQLYLGMPSCAQWYERKRNEWDARRRRRERR